MDKAREQTYPPPFPDGWYRIAASREIKPGKVKHVQCLGEQIALFRSRTTGRLSALDAFCPHLGANLAYGEVKGDLLQCPFHGWQLNGEGRVCNPSSYSELVHRHWEVIEHYGMVMIYHSAQGRQAPYQLPAEPKIDSRQLVHRGQYSLDAEMHIMEFAENTVDFSHFFHIHGTGIIPWINIKLPWLKVRHKPSWFLDDTLEHVAYLRVESMLEIKGRAYESVKSQVLVTFLGPGGFIKFEFNLPRIGEIIMFQTHTPLEALRQQVNFRWFAPRRVLRILPSFVVRNWIWQYQQDMEIWKRKIYRKSLPPGIKGDDVILLNKMRKWYQQFYPEDPKEEKT